MCFSLPTKGISFLESNCPPVNEIVGTLSSDSVEAQCIAMVPHWRRATGFTPGDLSNQLNQIMKQVGERGELGRAFCAKHRQSIADPFSDALEITPIERESGMGRVIRISVKSPDVMPRVARMLLNTGIMQSVHPVVPYRLNALDDHEYGTLPSQYPGSWAHRVIHASEALAMEPGRSDVLVAVLDSGVDFTHPELKSRLVPGYDFVHITDEDPTLFGDVLDRDRDATDQAGHGTHVAGVIAARGMKMLPGIGGECRILPVRVLGTMREGQNLVGVGIVPDIDDGIKFAVDRGADVINLSLGITAIGSGIPHRRAIEYARQHNVVVVAASGNDGTSTPIFPGAVPGVITVGAITEMRRVAGFSSWGPFLDVAAPGTAIYSTDIGGGYRYRTGTSHAAPFVTGVAALLIARARHQGLALRESTIRHIIRETADRPDTRRADSYLGAGVLNALDAIMLVSHLIRSQIRSNRFRSQPDISDFRDEFTIQ